jgi:hypothetical protein
VRYARRKQVITGVSFFLSSGAAATLIASAPKWIPTTLAVIVALFAAYSMAVGLDRRIGAVCKLHSEWNHLNSEYERLWDHWYEEEAQETLTELLKRLLQETIRHNRAASGPSDERCSASEPYFVRGYLERYT